MNEENLNSLKQSFLLSCQQYERMGVLLKLLAKAVSHPVFSKTMVSATLQRILDQYREIGEQLKVTGTSLDECGGSPVFQPKEKPVAAYKERKKQSKKRMENLKEFFIKGAQEKKEEEEKKTENENDVQVFVNNIEPDREEV